MNETSPLWSSDKLLNWLTENNINNSTITHTAMRTVDDSRAHRTSAEGAYTKNLFVRNKKGKMWLITLLENRQVNLKQLAKYFNAGNFSFASEQRLMENLGVIPGAVSPLALVNAPVSSVQFLLDSKILSFRNVHFHPLDNRMTTTLSREDFLKVLALINHEPILFDPEVFTP